MELQRQEYPAMLESMQPSQAVAILNDRVRQIGKVNKDIADWLEERRRIEEIYVKGLRQLASKQLLDETNDLGVFATPWQRIVGAMEVLAESHSTLAKRIEMDVERPLREYATSSREMQAMPNTQGNLAAVAKEYESAQKKADKSATKTARGSAIRTGSSSGSFGGAAAQWESVAPFAFESLQAADESRCNHLRDVLTQLQTHEVDQIEKARRAAESVLNALLSVETSDEIKTFALKNAGGTRRSERRQSRSQQGPSLQPPPSLNRAASSEDITTQRTESFQEEKEKKSRLGGLRRLGTVMSRRKSTQPGSYSRSNLGASTMSNGDRGLTRLDSLQERSAGLPVLDPISSPPLTQNLDEPAAVPGAVNGLTDAPAAQLAEPLQPSQPQPRAEALDAREETTRDIGFTGQPTVTPAADPITQAEQEAAAAGSAEMPAQALNLNIRNAPIADESVDNDAAMANMASALRAQAPTPKRTGTNRGRRDVRQTWSPSYGTPEVMTGPSPPAAEQTPVMESPKAMSPIAAPPAASSSFSNLTQGAPFMTPFMTSMHPPASQQPEPQQQSSPAQAQPASFLQAHRSSASDDATSIRSVGSTGAALKHPDMQAPGLNASVIETISVWQSDSAVTKAIVTGEVALAHQPTPAASESDTIRLSHFSNLERVAPNPAVVTQSANEGEYKVNVTAMPTAMPLVAFKYQLRMTNDLLVRQAPFLLTPTWKVEANQTSVILNCSLNPALVDAIPLSGLRLNNVVIAIYLDSSDGTTGKPTTCLSKPAGMFARERSMIYWRLTTGDAALILGAGAAPERLLARFTTDGEAKPGRVEAKWEINLAQGPSIDGLGSGLGVLTVDTASDPFADQAGDTEKGWKDITASRKLVSGTYTSTSA